MFRIIALFAICAGIVSAQDAATYQAWMKATPGQVTAIRNAIMAGDNAKVKAEADKLADMYQQVADFWQKRMKEDAVKIAQTTRDAAKEVAAATTAETQTAGVTKIQGTCAACHRVYREGPQGGPYKIKE
jgi:hypothetical protein